jgi:hypothetical protein
MNKYELEFHEKETYQSDVIVVEARTVNEAVNKFFEGKNVVVRKALKQDIIDADVSFVSIWAAGSQRDKYAMYHGRYGAKHYYIVEGKLKNNKNYVCSSLVGKQYIEQLREYIMDDTVRKERFTDIEICCEDDNEYANKVLDEKLKELTWKELEQIAKEEDLDFKMPAPNEGIKM